MGDGAKGDTDARADGTTPSHEAGAADVVEEAIAPGETTFTLPDGGGAGRCFDFTTGEHGFAAQGKNVKLGAAGYEIVVSSHVDSNEVHRTFVSDTAITFTNVVLDMTITGARADSEPGLSADAVTLFYGTPDPEAVARTAIAVYDGASVNVYFGGGAQRDDVGSMSFAGTTDHGLADLNGELFLESHWGKDGSITLGTSKSQVGFPARTANTLQTSFTLQIGGFHSNDSADVTIHLRRACVALR